MVMLFNKRLGFLTLTTLAIVTVQSVPVSAQRYCQREPADDDAVDQGCTAPVGGPITRTDPSSSFRTSPASTSSTTADEAKLEDLIAATADK
jgi:hypothetical protein